MNEQSYCLPPDPTVWRRRLLSWFDKHGRKELPWQVNKTPYRVWVSEIMLQQTQVATVIPYYLRFMSSFPSITALAQAPSDEVLHLWAGLGYYTRARNLHKAAKMVMEQHHGVLPDTLEGLLTLPGIGESTAGAILSIAFGQRATILDGNVKRVLARIHGITEPINQKDIENQLWNYADQYTPTKRAADYTQAIMDLGATVCTRSKPSCNQCPLTTFCIARQNNLTSLIPAKKTSRPLPVKTATFLLIEHNHRILLYKRPSIGIWGGLWSLPEIAGKPDNKAIRAYIKKQCNIQTSKQKILPPFRHTFSHYHLDIHPVHISVEHPLDKLTSKIMEAEQQIWYNRRKPNLIGLPKPVQTLLGDYK